MKRPELTCACRLLLCTYGITQQSKYTVCE